MQALTIDGKTFTLKNEHLELGEIIYANELFLGAELRLSGSEIYHIKPTGILDTRMAVIKGGEEVAHLTMTWGGVIQISYQDGYTYHMKLSHFFSGKFCIEDEQGVTIIQLLPKFDWRKFRYQFELEYELTDGHSGQEPLLLLLGVYACNYFIACLSGANAGIM